MFPQPLEKRFSNFICSQGLKLHNPAEYFIKIISMFGTMELSIPEFYLPIDNIQSELILVLGPLRIITDNVGVISTP